MFKNPCAKRKIFFIISIVLVVVSVLSMAVRGFNLGIDFTSGTTFEIEHLPEGFAYSRALEDDLKALISDAIGNDNIQIQKIGEDGVFIKVSTVEAEYEEATDATDATGVIETEGVASTGIDQNNAQTAAIIDVLMTYFNEGEVAEDVTEIETTTEAAVIEEVVEEETLAEGEVATDASSEEETTEALALTGSDINISSVSATTSARLIADTFKAVVIAIILMLIYISWRFDFKSGVSAVMALAHDVIIMFGFYSIFQLTMNTSFVAAVLTIIGYSINATIVVFDRVRENQRNMKGSYDEIANKAITSSYTRTLYSSLTTLFTIGALYVLGVSSIQEFALPIIVGIVSGAYSSLFVAPTFWAVWKGSDNK